MPPCPQAGNRRLPPRPPHVLLRGRDTLHEEDALSIEAETRGSRVDYIGKMKHAADDEEMVALAARCILQEFDDYYLESRRIPEEVKRAFEQRDPARALELSKRRLSIYSEGVRGLAAEFQRVYPLLSQDTEFWEQVEEDYLPLVEGRYEEDLALAFAHSTRRMIFKDHWRPVKYSFGAARSSFGGPRQVHRDVPAGPRLTRETVLEIFKLPGFSCPWRNVEAGAQAVADRVNSDLGLDGPGESAPTMSMVQMVEAGFFRDRMAFLVGRIVMSDGRLVPLVLALVNLADGIVVDAVLTCEADAHNIFSSTLANFHVTNPYYHELAAFLHSILTRRALGLHYSTIGFNHVGKVTVMNEVRRELVASGEVFATAPGLRGTVAIAFSAPSSNYVLKVIRDEPTPQYKWDHFPGRDAVLAKYDDVHAINRTGSMLDNIVYRNLELDRSWFDPDLVEELLANAGGTVSAEGGTLVFRHLIAQARMVPLPVFLETASPEDAETVIVNLGWCIKNNAAGNIFNKDLDGRNYGVGRFLKVFLFDYDAVEVLTDVKIHTNTDRVEGEEDIPDWFFEDGVIFLPEEIEVGLRVLENGLRRPFRAHHGDLATVRYWERMQNALGEGRVPPITVYPHSRRLPREEPPAPEADAQDEAYCIIPGMR